MFKSYIDHGYGRYRETFSTFIIRSVYFTGMPATGIFWLFCRHPFAHAQYLDPQIQVLRMCKWKPAK